MNTTYIDKLAWIYIKDRKLLGARSKGKIPFYVPGGKREPGETDLEALNREVTEEFDVHLVPDSTHFFGIFEAQAHGKTEGTIVRMACYTADFIGTMQPQAEIEEIGWLVFSDRDTDKCSPVDKLILDDLQSKNLID